jgi:hypothetical protein
MTAAQQGPQQDLAEAEHRRRADEGGDRPEFVGDLPDDPEAAVHVGREDDEERREGR